MNIEQLRSQFQIIGLSLDQVRRDEYEESLLKEGYQVRFHQSEESLVAQMGEQPGHIVIVDLMYIEWKLPLLIETILQNAPETVFVFYGPADMFERTIAYRSFGLIQFVPEGVFPQSFLTWACDMAVSHLYQRYQNEELLKQGGGGSKGNANDASNNEQIQLLSSAESIDQLFSHLFSLVEPGQWKLAYFRFIPSRFSFILSSTFGTDFESVKGVGLELSEEQAKDFQQFVADIQQQTEFIQLMKSVFSAENFIVTPLNSGSQLGGLLVAFSGDSNIEELIPLTQVCFEKLSLQDRLATLQVLDAETELFTKDYYQKGLADEVSRSKRLRLPLAQLHIHVDNYDRFLNEYGDQHASILIRSLASIVRKTSRVNDISSRTKPNEIKVLLPHTDIKGAGIRAERLRRIIMQSEFPMRAKEPVTISVGVSEYPSICRDAEGLESSSAKALKQVLSNGGNKVCLAAAAAGFQPDFSIHPIEAKP